MTDEAGTVITYNGAAEALTGIPVAFPAGKEHARREMRVGLSRGGNDGVRIWVADTGIGIPPISIPRRPPLSACRSSRG